MAEKDKKTELEIVTIDNTDDGFKSVATNFEIFGKQVSNLEKNLLPLNRILNAGLVSGAALSGLGAYTKNAGNLGGAL